MRSTTASILAGWIANSVPHPAGVDTRGLLHGNVAPRFASVTDGTSNTIMVSEDAGRPQYWLNGKLIPDGSIIPGIGETGPTIYTNEGSGWGWADYNSEFYTDGDGSRQHTNWSSNNEVYAFHPGGANHVFADGSVHFDQAVDRSFGFCLADQSGWWRSHLERFVLIVVFDAVTWWPPLQRTSERSGSRSSLQGSTR